MSAYLGILEDNSHSCEMCLCIYTHKCIGLCTYLKEICCFFSYKKCCWSQTYVFPRLDRIFVKVSCAWNIPTSGLKNRLLSPNIPINLSQGSHPHTCSIIQLILLKITIINYPIHVSILACVLLVHNHHWMNISIMYWVHPHILFISMWCSHWLAQ